MKWRFPDFVDGWWFAWYPVCCDDGTWVWLEVVLREFRCGMFSSGYSYYKVD